MCPSRDCARVTPVWCPTPTNHPHPISALRARTVPLAASCPHTSLCSDALPCTPLCAAVRFHAHGRSVRPRQQQLRKASALLREHSRRLPECAGVFPRVSTDRSASSRSLEASARRTAGRGPAQGWQRAALDAGGGAVAESDDCGGMTRPAALVTDSLGVALLSAQH